jgi:hypothetical protein
MELKDFISETIQQISLGVKDAMDKCAELDVLVNPDITTGENGNFCIPDSKYNVNIQRRVQIIDMDISVVVTATTENKMGGMIGISMIGIGGETKGIENTSNTNRVKFSIPVCLPVSKAPINEKPKQKISIPPR